MLARSKLLFSVALAVACGAQASPPPVVERTPPQPPAKVAWARFAEVQAWPAANERTFESQGHLVSQRRAVVRVSPEARAAYLELVTDSALPNGTVVAMFHEGDGESGPVYVMNKAGGAWEFAALDSAGFVAHSNPDGCRRCHAGGVADSLFGLPRGGKESPASEAR